MKRSQPLTVVEDSKQNARVGVQQPTCSKEEQNIMSITLDSNTCPRCLGGIPRDDRRGMYPGALSRTDNKTYICSDCGTQEAIEDMFEGQPLSQDNWLFHFSMAAPAMRFQPSTVAEDAAEGDS